MPDSPVAFTTALFLHFLRVSVDMARFGEVAREMLFRSGGPIGKASVVTVVELVGASHWMESISSEPDLLLVEGGG
jgi:hypothetical protein